MFKQRFKSFSNGIEKVYIEKYILALYPDVEFDPFDYDETTYMLLLIAMNL